jgi:hypothetical protein
MRKHKPIPGTVRRIRNRCWACDKGGSVGTYRLADDIKDSVRSVHFKEKCILEAKEKYKAFAAGR